jgi:hypothetical protein
MAQFKVRTVSGWYSLLRKFLVNGNISAKARKLRNMNRKICKHVFRGLLTKDIGDATLDKSGQDLFNELSSKWKRLFRGPSTEAFLCLQGYIVLLSQFRVHVPRVLKLDTGTIRSFCTTFQHPTGRQIGTSRRLGSNLHAVEKKIITAQALKDYYRKVRDNCNELMNSNLLINSQRCSSSVSL